MGIDASWHQCERTNGTHRDCPIASAPGEWVIAAHNPASVSQSSIEVMVDSPKYQIYGYNNETKAFDVKAK